MKKKFLSMVTALVMLISLLPQGILTVSAATITAAQPSTDENGVYQIGTAAELYWFAAQVNGGTTDINAVLTANITVNTGVLTDEGYINSSNMDNFTSWTPIGNSSKQYTGTFNGNGKTISGLYFNNRSVSDTNAYYVGLFGYVGSGGRVSNVGVVGSYLEGSDYIGGVCGTNYGTIENCYNAGFLTSPNKAYIGGVCGENYGTIANCYNAGSVLLSGVCGYNSSSGIIENCYNAGTVRKRGSAYGVCSDNRNTIKNCYYLDTTGTDSYATPKTAEEFASGEVAYLLQSGQEADENGNTPEVWGQEIGIDTYPVQGGAKVYQVIAYAGCENNPGNESTAYSNTDAPVYGDHSFDSNGFCEYGDSGYQPAEWDETNNRCEISNAGQLYWFAQQVNGGTTDINAVLTANIDLSGTGNWTPIGNAANKYKGTFDGQNHTVKDMSITKQGNSSGLFGYTDGATIKNIIITGEITITAESYTEGYGSIVGLADNHTTVTNCHSSVNITIDSTMESTAGNCIGHIGGIIGKMHHADSPISNCSYSGTIELKDKPINVAAGIVGYAIYSSVPITNCSFTGKINSTNTGATIIGGIFGYTRSTGDVKVTNCLSVGTITKSGDTSVTGILIGQINTGYGNNAVKNNYCISSSINVIGSTTGAPTTAPATLCTETQLTSGEVAYLLQSGQEADENGNIPEVWGQDLSTANTYPVPGGAKVYQVIAYAGCENNPGNEGTAYSNTDAPVYGDHSYDSNGFGVCGDSLYQPAKWDDTNNRYEISNAGQLYWFAAQVNGGTTDINAVLTDNIVVNTGVLTDEGYFNSSNMDNCTSWTPIGNSSKQYSGTFDGQGYTVSGLYFNNRDTNACYVGLFGYVGSGSRVSNVGVVDSYFGGYDYIGGVCGANYGTIENCYNAGFLVSPIYAYIGGVCGANYGTIANCYNIGRVILNGVCGYNGPSGIIENCYNAGTVSERGGSAYGVCGDSRKIIKNCYYLDTTAADHYATPKTAEEFASGEVAYLLNGSTSEGTLVWGQDLSTANSYPVITSDIAKKVLKVEFKTLGAAGEYALYAEKYGNYGKVLSDFPGEIRETIWVDGVNQFTASSTVTEDKTVYSVGYSVKYDDGGKVVISSPKTGNYTIIIASYSGKSLLRAKSADINLESWVDLYEIIDLNGFDTAGADTVKVFFWDTEMRPQCDAAVKTLP